MNHQVYLKKLKGIYSKSNCLRREIKCLAIDPSNGNAIGTGVNKSLMNCKSCYRDVNNIKSGTHNELCGALHAEQDLIIKYGDKLKDSYVYLTNKPCITCLKLLIAIGVKKIIYINEYPNNEEIYNRILENSDIELIQMNIE